MIIATIGTIRKVSRRRSGERRGGWSSGVGWTWPEASFSSASGSGATAGQSDISYAGFHDAIDHGGPPQMQGLMQDVPLTLPHLFERAERLFFDKEVVTVTATGRDRYTYGTWAERTRQIGRAACRERVCQYV